MRVKFNIGYVLAYMTDRHMEIITVEGLRTRIDTIDCNGMVRGALIMKSPIAKRSTVEDMVWDAEGKHEVNSMWNLVVEISGPVEETLKLQHAQIKSEFEAKYKKELDILNHNVATFGKHNDQLKHQSAEYQQEIAKHRKDRDTYEMRIRNLMDRNERLEKSCADYDKENAKLKKHLEVSEDRERAWNKLYMPINEFIVEHADKLGMKVGDSVSEKVVEVLTKAVKMEKAKSIVDTARDLAMEFIQPKKKELINHFFEVKVKDLEWQIETNGTSRENYQQMIKNVNTARHDNGMLSEQLEVATKKLEEAMRELTRLRGRHAAATAKVKTLLDRINDAPAYFQLYSKVEQQSDIIERIKRCVASHVPIGTIAFSKLNIILNGKNA